MATTRTKAARIPLIGSVIGLATVAILRGRRRRRPTGAELGAMDEQSFAGFVEATGLKTVTTAGLDTSGQIC